VHRLVIAAAVLLTALGILTLYLGIFRAKTDGEALACILAGVGCLFLLLITGVATLV